MNRKQFLNVKSIIEENIKNWFNDNYGDKKEGLTIKKVKIYKNMALVVYNGPTFEGFKLINLKTLNVINCTINVIKNITITDANGSTKTGVIKIATRAYDDIIYKLIHCKKSNDIISIYNF